MYGRNDPFSEHLTLSPTDHILLCNLSAGDMVAALSDKAAHLSVYHPDCGVLAELRARFRDVPNVAIHDTVFPQDTRGTVALLGLPVSPGFAKALLSAALEALAPYGKLLVAGHRTLGGDAALRAAQTIGQPRVLSQDDTYIVFEIQTPLTERIPPDWTALQKPQPFEYPAYGTTYTVYSQPGIFSWDKLEKGAAFLIDNLEMLALPQGGVILDAGCGYGLLGQVLRAYTRAQKTVWVDINRLAIMATQHGLPAETVLCADLTQTTLPDYGPFDLIFCNPPFYDPYKDNTDFMRLFTPRVPAMLKPGGVFLVVTRAVFKFHEFMAQHFPSMEIVTEQDGFCIMLGHKPS